MRRKWRLERDSVGLGHQLEIEGKESRRWLNPRISNRIKKSIMNRIIMVKSKRNWKYRFDYEFIWRRIQRIFCF